MTEYFNNLNGMQSLDYSEFKPDTIVQSVVDSFIQRAKIGKEKYGQTLDREDLSIIDWIRHAKEEHMDAILYLTKLERELSKINSEKGL